MDVTAQLVFEHINNEEQELLIAIISNEMEVEGFEQKENSLIAFILKKNLDETLVKSITSHTYIKTDIPIQNWNAVWESNFDPVVVGNFCAIRAHFHEPIKNVAHEILITPKMSFGTGHHATTFQVIEAMKSIDFNGKSVCDFGTGTGVLAILAYKLGAKDIIALDNDDWSIENTIENIANNNCSSIIVQKVEQIVGNEYDIILANINKNVLLTNMSMLKKRLASNGTLIISGILKEDLNDMEASFLQNSFTISNLSEKNNWLCISLKHTF
jgi:ribosomal protein L11 methyltransferase